MKIIAIDDIKRINDHIHYRKKYSANLKYEVSPHYEDIKKIVFALESDATGGKRIFVDFVEQPDYPIFIAKKKVIEYVKSLEEKGLLI